MLLKLVEWRYAANRPPRSAWWARGVKIAKTIISHVFMQTKNDSAAY